MTCIIALKKDNKIVLGADSLTTLETNKLVNVINDSKIVEFKRFTIAVAGDGPILDTLEAIRDDNYEEDYDWSYHELNGRQDCSNFILHFIEKFQERTPEMGAEDLKYEFLFTNYKTVWWGVGGPSVFEIGSFWACGSGSAYALGYLEAVYNTDKKLDEMVYGAITASIKYETQCGAPIEIKIY